MFAVYPLLGLGLDVDGLHRHTEEGTHTEEHIHAEDSRSLHRVRPSKATERENTLIAVLGRNGEGVQTEELFEALDSDQEVVLLPHDSRSEVASTVRENVRSRSSGKSMGGVARVVHVLTRTFEEDRTSELTTINCTTGNGGSNETEAIRQYLPLLFTAKSNMEDLTYGH